MKTNKFLVIIALIVLASLVTDLFFADFSKMKPYELAKMALLAIFSMMTLYQYIRESGKKI